MKKQYRTELRQLRRLRNKAYVQLSREVRACDRERERIVKDTARRVDRANRRSEIATLKLDRRIAILEGRLS